MHPGPTHLVFRRHALHVHAGIPCPHDALLRAGGLLVSIATISLLRYATGSSQSLAHELSLRLYYVPILVSAYWYGVVGGLAIAFVSSIAYVHHMLPVTLTFDTGRYAEVVVFHAIAVCVGLLANAQRRVTVGYQRAAATLDSANRELRESHGQIRTARR